MNRTKRRLAWLTPILALSLLAAACGDDDDDDAGSDTTEEGGDSGGDSGACPTDVEGDVNVSGSSTVEPISTAVGESCSTADRDSRRHGRRSRHRRRLRAVLRRRDRHLRRLPPDRGGGGRRLRGGRRRVHRAQDRHRRHLGDHQPGQRGRRVPQLRRPLRPGRPGVRGLRQLDRRPGHRHRARVDHRASPTRTSSVTAPGAESGTYDSFIEIALEDIAEDSRRRITEDQAETTGRTTPRRPTTTPSSRASRAPTPAFGWVGFAFAEEAGDGREGDRRLGRARRRVRRADRRDDRQNGSTRSPRPVHLREHGQSRGERGARRLRRLLPADEGISSVVGGRLRRPRPEKPLEETADASGRAARPAPGRADRAGATDSDGSPWPTPRDRPDDRGVVAERPPRRPAPYAQREGRARRAAVRRRRLDRDQRRHHLLAGQRDLDLRHQGRLEHRLCSDGLVPPAGRLRHSRPHRRQPVG